MIVSSDADQSKKSKSLVASDLIAAVNQKYQNENRSNISTETKEELPVQSKLRQKEDNSEEDQPNDQLQPITKHHLEQCAKKYKVRIICEYQSWVPEFELFRIGVLFIHALFY